MLSGKREYVLTGQSTHTEPPDEARYVPAGHGKQLLEPLVGANEPGLHSVQNAFVGPVFGFCWDALVGDFEACSLGCAESKGEIPPFNFWDSNLDSC